MTLLKTAMMRNTPVRECGLKLTREMNFRSSQKHSRKGVWIETKKKSGSRVQRLKHSRKGVWIETFGPDAYDDEEKHSRKGVWIETQRINLLISLSKHSRKGVWIETKEVLKKKSDKETLP